RSSSERRLRFPNVRKKARTTTRPRWNHGDSCPKSTNRGIFRLRVSPPGTLRPRSTPSTPLLALSLSKGDLAPPTRPANQPRRIANAHQFAHTVHHHDPIQPPRKFVLKHVDRPRAIGAVLTTLLHITCRRRPTPQ